MKILSWNCRGLRRRPVKEFIRSYVKLNFVNIIFLQETHVHEEIALSFISCLGKSWYGSAISSEGASGGFLLAWNNSVIKAQLICSASDALKIGFKELIGNGHTSILFDSWLFDVPLFWMPSFVNISLFDANLNVDCLIDNGSWNVAMLYDLFGVSLVETIFGIMLPRKPCDDDWVWWPDNKGDYF
ncbi:hypothetical protein Cni_G29445 [Canna indica]|uniref:Endonuclease/exonuclease/phosphatase domain-containing protein n=1 Tax=Canna indica TaxID=4628 RepID=A0AAQ3QU05_9LILI|nr:hypothetical protein Cni_G29445 [Canna indica]